MILQSTIQGDESLWSNSLFYKYLSVIFLYTNEYSCVQDRGNSRMIRQTPSDKLTQSTGAQNSRLPGTTSLGSPRDGAQITNRVIVHPPQLLTNVCFRVSVSENVPRYKQALQMIKTEHRTVILDAFPTARMTMIRILKCLHDVPMVLFCFTKQQTDIQQRNELQYLRMVTFIDK